MYKPKPATYETIKDFSTNQIVYACCQQAQHKDRVTGVIWDVALQKSAKAYPRESSYQAAKILLKEKGLDSAKKVGFLVDYFWQVTKHN